MKLKAHFSFQVQHLLKYSVSFRGRCSSLRRAEFVEVEVFSSSGHSRVMVEVVWELSRIGRAVGMTSSSVTQLSWSLGKDSFQYNSSQLLEFLKAPHCTIQVPFCSNTVLCGVAFFGAE